MTSQFFRACAPLASAVLGALAASTAFAADMPFFAPPPEPAFESPVEFGTGWYLRGDIGAAQNNVPWLNNARQSASFPNNWTVGLGGGYQFNNWFRADITADYEAIQNLRGASGLSEACITNWTLVDVNLNVYTPIWGLCNSIARTRIETAVVMANGYVDLGRWWGVTPYVGGGVGVNVMYQKSQINFYLPNGLSATQTWPVGLLPYYQNLDQQTNSTDLRFAWAAMAGVAYDLTDHIKVDVGYRFLDLGRIDGLNPYGVASSRDLRVHQVRAGIRYMID